MSHPTPEHYEALMDGDFADRGKAFDDARLIVDLEHDLGGAHAQLDLICDRLRSRVSRGPEYQQAHERVCRAKQALVEAMLAIREPAERAWQRSPS